MRQTDVVTQKLLTQDDYEAAAGLLSVDVAAIKAVAEVESAGAGFLKDGRLRILFEGHVFHRYTRGRFSQSHRSISHPSWDRSKYAKGKNADARGAGEWKRLDLAKSLDRTAALMSCSIGRFQVMGFNFTLCGFKTVGEFWQRLEKNEGEHLVAFCQYIIASGLDDELARHDWPEFARRYNGPQYRKNQYDSRLAEAFAKYSRES